MQHHILPAQAFVIVPLRRYMTKFSDEYVAAVPRASLPAVDWLAPFVRDFIDVAEWEARAGQFVCQGVRLRAAVGAKL